MVIMTRTTIPNCPQPETPIRDRAWTDEQRLARLLELAERLDVLAHAVTEAQWSEFSMRVPVEPKRDADCVLSQAAIDLRSYAAILDAEGDGGAAPAAWLCDARDGSNCDAVVSTHARDTYAHAGRTITPLYPHPAQSGGVSDADVEAACRAYIAADRFLLDGAVASMREPMRAALTHFAKGADVDGEDADRKNAIEASVEYLKGALDEVYKISGSALLAGEKCKNSDTAICYQLACSVIGSLISAISDLEAIYPSAVMQEQG